METKKKHEFKIIGETVILFGERRCGERFEFEIDKDDLEKVIKHNWCMSGRRKDKKGYLTGRVDKKNIYLHHFVFKKPGVGEEIDHINRDTFNNKKENLRCVHKSINRVNRTITNKHGFPGITFLPEAGTSFTGGKNGRPWQARIRIKNPNGRSINNGGGRTSLLHLGVFKTKEEAIEARKKAELKYFGHIFH